MSVQHSIRKILCNLWKHVQHFKGHCKLIIWHVYSFSQLFKSVAATEHPKCHASLTSNPRKFSVSAQACLLCLCLSSSLLLSFLCVILNASYSVMKTLLSSTFTKLIVETTENSSFKALWFIVINHSKKETWKSNYLSENVSFFLSRIIIGLICLSVMRGIVYLLWTKYLCPSPNMLKP